MTFHGAASNPACLRKRTAAKEVQALGSGANGKAIKGIWTQNNEANPWFKSTLKSLLGRADDGSSAGWLSAAESEGLARLGGRS